ncbi:MAG: TonB-dependent receptor [Nitrosomonadales bacterium]|nr:TonB-dependent receptor [Nitrosomonadales bacterium]
MKQRHIFAALLVAATPLAQAATEMLDEVVVTATRTEQALTQTLSHTTVITRKDIETSQAADVPALLKGLAGVEVYQNGGIGKQSSLFMRGTNSSHTLVLLDGVRINSATAGTTQIDQLMLDQIERIEVVRGNVSSLYGSEAIGGVIQIFTRRGKGEPSVNGSIGVGSYKTRRITAGFGGGAEDDTFNLQVSKYKTDGVSAVKTSLVPGVNPDKDGYDNASVSANLRHAFGSAHSMSVSMFDSKATSQNDNAFGLSTDVNSSKSHIQKFAVASDNRLSEGWLSKLQFSRGMDDTQNYLNGAPDAMMGAQFKTTSDLFSWQHTLRVGGSDALVVGWEKLKQQVASSTLFTRTNRTDDSLFAGYTANFGAEQLQMNYRKDKYSDFGTAKTWLLGYGGNIAESWRLTASMATAFKAPTLNDLFYPFVDWGFGYSYIGNPNLKPEHSRNKELGLHYAKAGQRLDVVYFENRIHDLIAINTLPASTMVNLNEARIEGAELTLNEQFGDTGVKLSVTRQNPRDANTGQTLLRRARNFASLVVVKQYGALKMGGEWQYSGVRTDIDINSFARTTLAPYDLANLTANYALDQHFELSVRVDNLFNRDYMLAHGYNTLRRTVFVGLNYR